MSFIQEVGYAMRFVSFREISSEKGPVGAVELYRRVLKEGVKEVIVSFPSLFIDLLIS